jgi:hypothetical protein
MRRITMKKGDLVYFDTLKSGLVPCKVLEMHEEHVDLGYSQHVNRTVTVKVTADRYAYPKGMVVQTALHHVIERSRVYVRDGRILWIK